MHGLNWEDFSNIYGLRPENIVLKLYRSADNGTTWETDPIRTQCLSSSDVVSGNSNQWTYTFDKLLKFDQNNAEYVFKIVEDTVNAYKLPVFTTEKAVTSQECADKHNPNPPHELELTNSLDVHDIKVEKVWNDNGYNGSDKNSLHYKIQVKLTSQTSEGIPNVFEIEYAPDNSNDIYEIAAVQGNASNGFVTIPNVPIFDRNGDPIQYTASEKPCAGNDNLNYGDKHYGYKMIQAVTESTMVTGKTNTIPNTITITNTLPLTDVNVTKSWSFSEVYSKYKPADIQVDVVRNTTSDSDNKIHSDATISYTSGSASSGTFAKELVYDYNNQPYTYTVTEKTPIQGYEAEKYTDNGNANESSNLSLELKNREIMHDVQFTKIDGTFEQLYRTYPGYQANIPKLPGAKFKLYRVKQGENDIQCYVTKTNETAGVYAFDKTQEASEKTDVIVSGNDGNIQITGMPLGEYKLVETEAPTGFMLSDNAAENTYTFTLDVTNVNAANDTYDGTLSDKMIRNEEQKATATLTKMDAEANTAITTSKATYYLLRLIPHEVNTDYSEQSDAKYLEIAKSKITGFDFTNPTQSKTELEKYWQIVKTVQTGDNGSVTVPLIEHGTYFFMEYNAPIGYRIDNNTSRFIVGNDSTDVFTVTQKNHNAMFTITHSDPRKSARVKIFKSDDFGNGLNGAVFKLYKKGQGSDNCIATVLTGDDGMNKYVAVGDKTPEYMRVLTASLLTDTINSNEVEINLASDNAIILDEWTNDDGYYFSEVSAPFGYEESPIQNQKYEFKVNYEEANQVVTIVRANDARKKGSVVLTKIAGERVGSYKTGDALTGATFRLKKKDGTYVTLSLKDPYTRGHYSVDKSGTYGTDLNPLLTDDSENEIGKLYIDNLDWGEYDLEEITAPTGFTISSPVSFSVGRNNCNEVQQLICRNMGARAQLNITKGLSEYRSNWGEPTFLFKVKQTDGSHSDKTVTITFDSEVLTKTVENISIEPGTYEVTEINVSRYKLNRISGKVNNIDIEDNNIDLTNRKITFTVDANQTASLTFSNEIEYYDKFSHTAIETNEFKGVIGIKASDITVSTGEGTLNNDGYYYKSVDKSALNAALLQSNDADKPLNQNEMKNFVISYNGTGKPYDDSRFKVLDNADSDSFSVMCDPIITSGYVYTLTASYNYQGHTFTTNFIITFTEHDNKEKKEVRVIFKNDDDNESYFKNGGTNTAQYEFTYVLIEDSESSYKVKEIKHNGVVISSNEDYNVIRDVNSSLNVSDALSSNYTFTNKWKDEENTVSVLTAEHVKAKVLANASGTITYTAVLDNAAT